MHYRSVVPLLYSLSHRPSKVLNTGTAVFVLFRFKVSSPSPPTPRLPLPFSVYVSLPLPISACCCLFMLTVLLTERRNSTEYPAASATETRLPPITLPPASRVWANTALFFTPPPSLAPKISRLWVTGDSGRNLKYDDKQNGRKVAASSLKLEVLLVEEEEVAADTTSSLTIKGTPVKVKRHRFELRRVGSARMWIMCGESLRNWWL